MDVEEEATNGLSKKDLLAKESTTRKDLKKFKKSVQESVISDHHPNDKEPDEDHEVIDLKSNSKSATPNGDLKKDSSSGDETADDSPTRDQPDSGGSGGDDDDDGECLADSKETSVTGDKKVPKKKSSTPNVTKGQDGENERRRDDDGDDGEIEDDSSDSDDQVLADIAKSTKSSEKDDSVEKNGGTEDNAKTKLSKRPRRGSKEQTIIVTETKSLAQAINEAVKKPDGKPTLVIIETKTPTSTNTNSNGMVTSTNTSSTTLATKSIVKVPPTSVGQHLTSHNSLRSALLQGSAGIATRSQSRPFLNPPGIAKQSVKPDTASQQGLALKDDAEINVYTPSLLVPYLFECPPKENLKEFLKKIAPPEVINAEKEQKKKEQEVVDDCEPPLPKSGKTKTFFDTALGQFFVDIGLSQVQQWVQAEIYKSEKRKLDRGWKTKDRERMVKSLQKTLEEIKQKNSPFAFSMKRCKRCNFTTESEIVMERHLETIHINGAKMLCSFCSFESTDPSQIFQHLFSQHKAFGRLERPPNTHMCPMCPFEDSAKARVTRHTWKCAKTFVPEKNLCPSPDFEPPAKRIRHVASVATLKAMRAGVDKSEVAATGTSSTQLQNRSCTSLLTPLLAQQRGPPPIRPKPGDLRLTPTYVQSVLRGSYVPPTRSPYSGLLATSNTYVRTSTPLQTPTQSSFLTSRTSQQSGSLNSAAYSLQGNQIYQVVHTSAGSSVPVFRGGSVTSFTPPRFTILPTPPAIVNTRGPTPVALIPNLATTNKPTSGSVTSVTSTGSSAKSAVVSVSSTSSSVHTSVTATLFGKKPTQSTTQLSSKPNISITPVSKPTPTRSSVSSTSNTKSGTTPALQSTQSRPQQQQQQSNPSYVVCEICDGYIKDLDQLRNHMQWIHKVKIHPKMIHNRPPLNCQKCHFRFFTDQGLERHLLGSHGLVTSSMQENANKGKDGGRCIICGKVFLWKLVVHMAKDHKMTLKPAHLSYKCTVCSATFNMYRLFETHVYEEHSTVAKRVLDGQKTYPPVQSSQSSSSKAKVTITPTSVAAAASSSSSSSTSSSSTTKDRKSLVVTSVSSDATSLSEERCRSTEFRSCKECGTKFQPFINCQGHSGGKSASLKACQIKLCRVDKCPKCTVKKEKEDPEEMESPLNGKPSKRDHGEAKHESSKVPQTPNKKIKIEVEYETKDAQAEQSDGDDVFDMEVETVDDDHSSPGDVRTDVESD